MGTFDRSKLCSMARWRVYLRAAPASLLYTAKNSLLNIVRRNLSATSTDTGSCKQALAGLRGVEAPHDCHA
jgi:hypothetical protein